MIICVCSVQFFQKIGSDGLASSTKNLVSEFLSKTGKDSRNSTGVFPSEIHDVPRGA